MTVRVVCTAGHVDHGKSTLVRALTGMEPDRFAEERRRGLTIDLGFAWTELNGPSGPVTVSFVDLPGHERFIGNMLAGAGPVELALLVVAADEGWKPQSAEHLEILDLLGVSRGLVAVTKVDSVETDQVEAVTHDVRERLRGTSFGDVEAVAVSAVTGQGLDELRRQLAAVLAAAPAAADTGRPRLWVDRSFSIRGAGTVVTGTLGGGTLRVGDDVAIEPNGRRARIRGLESLKATLSEAQPGIRVAVNLSGVERTDVRRGDVLAPPDQLLGVVSCDVWVRTVAGATIGRKGAWHLHAGSGEWLVRVTPLPDDEVSGSGFVRLELGQPAPLVAGDRFVLREAGRRATLGGGLVLDCAPPAVRGAAGRAQRNEQLRERLAAVQRDDRSLLLALHITERGADDAARAGAAVGLSPPGLADAVSAHHLLRLGSALAAPAAASTWAANVTAALAEHHKINPVDRAARKDVAVRAAVAAGCPVSLGDALLDVLVRLGRVVVEGTGIRLPEHHVQLDDRQAAARQRLLDELDADPFSPPRLSEAAATAGAGAPLVRELEAAGEIVRLGPDLALSARAVEQAIALLRAAFAAEGPLTAARAKEVLGTTRKYAVPLLEHLDAQRVTRRTGDLREVL